MTAPDLPPDELRPEETRPEEPTPRRARPTDERRWIAGLLVIALLLVLPTIGLRTLIGREAPFCDRVADLPAISGSVDRDGTPGPALVAYADALERVAAAAPDSATADAARRLAAHQRSVGGALSGTTSGADVVAAVGALDDDAELAAARDELDRAIEHTCR